MPQRTTRDEVLGRMKELLLGSTSQGRMVINLQKLAQVMEEWPNSQKLDAVGAMYAFLFDDFWNTLKTDMIKEGASNPKSLQDTEEALASFIAARMSLDVTARIFKDKVFVVKLHKLANTLDDLDVMENPLKNLFEDHTHHDTHK